jgi:hexosaminidase
MEARFRERTKAGDAEGARRYLLSDPEDHSQYTSAQLYHDNVMNPTLESTYAFIERVVADLVATHKEAGVPLLHLHMGGDEVPNGVWQRSPAAQEFMKQKGPQERRRAVVRLLRPRRADPEGPRHPALGLGGDRRSQDEARRAGPFSCRTRCSAARGLARLRLEQRAGLGRRGPRLPARERRLRGRCCAPSPISTSTSPGTRTPRSAGLDWGGFVDLRKPFQFVPYDYYRNVRLDRRGQPVDPKLFVGKERLTDYGRENIVGIQGNLWSETLGGEGPARAPAAAKLSGSPSAPGRRTRRGPTSAIPRRPRPSKTRRGRSS